MRGRSHVGDAASVAVAVLEELKSWGAHKPLRSLNSGVRTALEELTSGCGHSSLFWSLAASCTGVHTVDRDLSRKDLSFSDSEACHVSSSTVTFVLSDTRTFGRNTLVFALATLLTRQW